MTFARSGSNSAWQSVLSRFVVRTQIFRNASSNLRNDIASSAIALSLKSSLHFLQIWQRGAVQQTARAAENLHAVRRMRLMQTSVAFPQGNFIQKLCWV